MLAGLRGEPGWVGEAVVLLLLDLDGDTERLVTRVCLASDGAAEVEDPAYLRRWQAEGIVGRAESGRLYPADGQAFLDELPFVYRGAHLRAVPEDEFFGATA